ncbi:hypothetical protein [Nonomuraea aridisoli]|nr:hypothetical protein [Nonomuraea aridisoli]
MRFASRIMLGFTAAAVAAVVTPAAAGASTASQAGWGPYFSADHKAAARGHVSVDRQRYRHWYWKTDFVRDRVCFKDHKGDRHCKWVVKKVKKKAWEWRYEEFFTVHSTLVNKGNRGECAWETFKVVHENGSTAFRSFANCGRHPRHFSFSGKNAAHISVDVSKGDHSGPTAFHSGWRPVHHAAV